LFLIGQFKKKSSLLKPLGQMNRNLVGSIYGRSSINNAITFRGIVFYETLADEGRKNRN
jgi:hypothetical protein